MFYPTLTTPDSPPWHRNEAHFTLHTIQIDKTLVAIGQAIRESKRLLRKVFAALTEVDGQKIGAAKIG
jgi:hypothetical protein